MEVSLPAPPFWICVLLGLVMIGAGILVLGDIMLVTLISTIFIGWVSIFAGAFEIVHAFWTKGWGGLVWQVLLGILYVAFGIVLVGQPVASALILTYVLGLVLLISGFVRILLGISHWREAGWIMLLSGAFGIRRPRDPDRFPDDGIVGPRIPARRRPDIAWDRLAGLRVATDGQDSEYVAGAVCPIRCGP